ncbi:hypothetical protein [Citrobacter portucalensis]|uniref:hypothetical protein n=1 Tax=Citrobacter portucalensis TaxID=1639133 RepID=UPI002B252E9C|nr:hypothetical protein [Citrobacter portucalensis]MEB1055694.1 hypothetical protein [Citrobacter portucalensis]
MSPDAKAIVDAIHSLNHTDSFLKSYIYPLLPAVISTLAGFILASVNFNKQECVKADAVKINNANKFIIKAESAFQSLMVVKNIYQDRLTNEPIQRAIVIGKVEVYFPELSGVEELIFLANGNTSRPGDAYYTTWNNIPRISAMLGNYLYAVERINARNKSREELFKHIPVEAKSLNLADLGVEGYKKLQTHVNDTEVIISIIDSLIIEFDSFLKNITASIKKSLNVDRVKHLSTIVNYNGNNPLIEQSLVRSPEPDYALLANILEMDENTVRASFRNYYFDTDLQQNSED